MQYDAPRFDPDSIVSSVLSGNEDAYRLIVSEYGLLVRGFLAARVYHLVDAEDLAQDTFVKAYELVPPKLLPV